MLKALSKIKNDFPLFCKTCLKIRTKEGSVEPFILNRSQLYFYECVQKQLAETGKVRLVVLKGRQIGLSTVIEALYFWKTIFKHGISAFILTHEGEATKNLFAMAKRYYEQLYRLRPTYCLVTGSANFISRLQPIKV